MTDSMDLGDGPAFIIRNADGSKEIAVYANGFVKGMEHLPKDCHVIINWIPALIATNIKAQTA